MADDGHRQEDHLHIHHYQAEQVEGYHAEFRARSPEFADHIPRGRGSAAAAAEQSSASAAEPAAGFHFLQSLR